MNMTLKEISNSVKMNSRKTPTRSYSNTCSKQILKDIIGENEVPLFGLKNLDYGTAKTNKEKHVSILSQNHQN